jgi:hypothetical protein
MFFHYQILNGGEMAVALGKPRRIKKMLRKIVILDHEYATGLQ